MSRIHATLAPKGEWETNKEQLAELLANAVEINTDILNKALHLQHKSGLEGQGTFQSTFQYKPVKVWQGQHGTVPASPYLVNAWCNVGGTFPEPFWQPKTDLHLENHKNNAVGKKSHSSNSLNKIEGVLIHVNSFMIALI